MAGEVTETMEAQNNEINGDIPPQENGIGDQENDTKVEDGKTELAQNNEQTTNDKLIQLPLSRIKTIMKSDPDVTLASQEAVVALAKAAELFIQTFSKDAIGSTLQGKRKTLQRKDLDYVLDTRDAYMFLEGTLD